MHHARIHTIMSFLMSRATRRDFGIGVLILVACVTSLLAYHRLPQETLMTSGATSSSLTETKKAVVQEGVQQQHQQTSHETQPPRRRQLEFVSYTSSEWERLWLENLDTWIKPSDGMETCKQLDTEQAHFMHDFLKLMCTTRFLAPFEDWCRFDDFSPTPMYYNSSNRNAYQLSITPPEGLLQPQHQPIRSEPVIPTKQDEHIVSKFIFRDTETGEEMVEYIEPLVSHLRFPLAGCRSYDHIEYIVSKNYILPPDPRMRSSRRRYTNASRTNPYHDRYLYFDAGASSWSQGAGGPSLEYFANVWQRHGIVFDDIFAFEATTPAHEFYKSIPTLFWSDRTFYQQGYVSSRPEDDTPETPFIPKFIQRHATVQDYVIFKLDIDSPGVEAANIEFLIDTVASNNSYLWIDELFWEHHVYENPFMRGYWFPTGYVNQSISTMRGSYDAFLQMRKLGIRAHSWV